MQCLFCLMPTVKNIKSKQVNRSMLVEMASGNFDFGMEDILSSSQSSSIDEEDIQRIGSAAVPEGTSNATKSGVNKLSNWLRKRSMVEETKLYR